MSNSSYPRTPPRLKRVFSSYPHPIWFVTFCTYNRRSVLASSVVFDEIVRFFEQGEAAGLAWVGEAVLMPDHVHALVRPGREVKIGRWIGGLKRALSPVVRCASPTWQPGFFDHLVRHDESLDEKRMYIRLNPVRAGLVAQWQDWPYRWSRTMESL